MALTQTDSTQVDRGRARARFARRLHPQQLLAAGLRGLPGALPASPSPWVASGPAPLACLASLVRVAQLSDRSEGLPDRGKGVGGGWCARFRLAARCAARCLTRVLWRGCLFGRRFGRRRGLERATGRRRHRAPFPSRYQLFTSSQPRMLLSLLPLLPRAPSPGGRQFSGA